MSCKVLVNATDGSMGTAYIAGRWFADCVILFTMKATTLGQRQTRQRDAILKVLGEANGPLSTPEIFKLAKKVIPLGIATVYRTINLLLAAKEIQSVILPSGETRYESADLGHHDHFQCR